MASALIEGGALDLSGLGGLRYSCCSCALCCVSMRNQRGVPDTSVDIINTFANRTYLPSRSYGGNAPLDQIGGGLGSTIDKSLPLLAGLLTGSRWSSSSIGYKIWGKNSFEPFAADLVSTWGFTQANDNAAPMHPNELTAIQNVIGAFQDVSNLSFTETSDFDLSNINFASLDNLQLSDAGLSTATLGFAGFPSVNLSTGAMPGWVSAAYQNYVNPASPDLSPGSYDYLTWIHELGHALGLKHPHNQISNPTGNINPLYPGVSENASSSGGSYDLNGHPATVMTYRDIGSAIAPSSPASSGFLASLGTADIAAIQYLYGINTSARTGDDTYVVAPSLNGYWSIWDNGGTDVITAENLGQAVYIDLRNATLMEEYGGDGFLSKPFDSSQRYGFVVAYDSTGTAVIENAIGSSMADYITGNQVGNNIKPLGGNDTIDGAGGVDTVEFTGNLSDYSFSQLPNNGVEVVDNRAGSPDGIDKLYGIELMSFGDQSPIPVSGLFASASSRQNVVLLIDTSGSMWDDIAEVKVAATTIVNSLFGVGGNEIFSSLAIVDFNDGGESSPDTLVHLPFTNQSTVAARKQAALSAINSLAIRNGGIEPMYDGILTSVGVKYDSIGNYIGAWDSSAADNKVIIFSDEPPGDPSKKSQAIAAAKSLRFDLSQPLAPPRTSPASRATSASLSSVVIGGNPSLLAVAEELARETGGSVFTAANASAAATAVTTAITTTTQQPTAAVGGGGGGGSSSADSDPRQQATPVVDQAVPESVEPPQPVVDLQRFFGGTKKNDVIIGNEIDNRLEGLAGNDKLYGLGGDDVLIGGKGNDKMIGGEGADIFVVDRIRFGNDTIRDFALADDLIDLSALPVKRFKSLDIESRRGSALIQFAGGSSIKLLGVDLGVLDSASFVFGAT